MLYCSVQRKPRSVKKKRVIIKKNFMSCYVTVIIGCATVQPRACSWDVWRAMAPHCGFRWQGPSHEWAADRFVLLPIRLTLWLTYVHLAILKLFMIFSTLCLSRVITLCVLRKSSLIIVNTYIRMVWAIIVSYAIILDASPLWIKSRYILTISPISHSCDSSVPLVHIVNNFVYRPTISYTTQLS